MALTFDDGPDPHTTPDLLHLLSNYKVKATFFVIGKNAFEYPELIKKIIDEGHTLGNHTYHHDPVVMLKGFKTLEREITSARNLLKKYGVVSFIFRPPAGITNPKLKPILSKLNICTVNFSCRAMDRGNRQIKNLSENILKRIKPDDIILLHDIKPKNSEVHYWLNEVNAILSGIKEMGFSVVPLAELIGKPVNDRCPKSETQALAGDESTPKQLIMPEYSDTE